MSDPAQATVDRYAAAQRALLPPGRALSKAITGALSEIHDATSVEFARLHELAAAALRNTDPAQAVELLPEWEEALGLNGAGLTTAARQGAAVARLRGRTSHARVAFERAALDLGYGEETWHPLRVPVATNVVMTKTPTVMQSGRFRLRFTPRLDQTGYGGNPFLLYWSGTANGGNYVRIQSFGGKGNIYVYADGVFAAYFSNVFWSPLQHLTLEFDMRAGVTTLSGATSGNKTVTSAPWIWPSAALNVGQQTTATAVFDGAIDAIESYSRADLEFTTFPASVVGSAAAGQPVCDDSFANIVRINVLVGDQTADSALLEQFDFLRRAHGYLDIRLEGPMGAARLTYTYRNQSTLATTDTLAALDSVEIRFGGFISIQMVIDNGSGSAPSDAPAGTWELWISTDGNTFTIWNPTATTTELAKVAPNGNAVVGAWAILKDLPGHFVKLRYNRTSGGAGNSRCSAFITTW